MTKRHGRARGGEKATWRNRRDGGKGGEVGGSQCRQGKNCAKSRASSSPAGMRGLHLNKATATSPTRLSHSSPASLARCLCRLRPRCPSAIAIAAPPPFRALLPPLRSLPASFPSLHPGTPSTSPAPGLPWALVLSVFVSSFLRFRCVFVFSPDCVGSFLIFSLSLLGV